MPSVLTSSQETALGFFVDIMVLTEDLSRRKLLTEFLDGFCYTMSTPTTCDEARTSLREGQPKLVVIDWNFEGIHGLVLAVDLQRQQTTLTQYAVLIPPSTQNNQKLRADAEKFGIVLVPTSVGFTYEILKLAPA